MQKDFSNIRRNSKGILFESMRKTIDGRYNKVHDTLSDTYYNYWKRGINKDWHGFDVQSTQEESKTLFDKLQGLLWNKHITELNDIYLKSGEKDEKFERLHPQAYLDQAKKSIDMLKKENIDFEL